MGCVNLGPLQHFFTATGSRMDDISHMVLSPNNSNSEVPEQETPPIVHCRSPDHDKDGRQPQYNYEKWTFENTKHRSGVRCQHR